jgi:hypothetical protein
MRMRTTRQNTTSQSSRGSVLVFAVVVLSILLMLASAYLLVVRQSRAASTNALNRSEADLAAESGKNEAVNVIRRAFTYGIPVTPDGIFDPGQPAWLNTDYHPAVNTSQSVNPLRHFAVDSDDPEYEKGAPLLKDPGLPSYFTISPMSINADLFGQPVISNGLEHIDRAWRNELIGKSSDFHHDTAPNIQQLRQVAEKRGEYFVWIEDLDAKFYAVPQAWGIDTRHTSPELIPDDNDPVAIAARNTAIQKSILTNLRDTYAAEYSAPSETVAHLLSDDDLIKITDPAATSKTFSSIHEFALTVDSLDPNTTPYPMHRGALQHYFTVHQDVPDNTNALPTKFIKDRATAININTASEEVIAAALSQIPAEDIADPANQTLLIGSTPGRALNLARRIIAKRPFLCRMDFEDFLAAHIRGSYEPVIGINLTPPGTLSVPPAVDYTTDEVSIVHMLYYAIDKRIGTGGVTAAPDGTAYDGSELTLSQYLEVPGVPETPTRPEVYKRIIGGIPAWPNDPRYQKARFEFFYGSDTERGTLDAEGALITPKEFNNIINSVTSVYACDDVQEQFPDRYSHTVALPPSTIVVSAGPDGTLNTYPQGDDVLDLATKTITAGPNGIPETWIAANRPSYYSFVNEEDFITDFWSKIYDALVAGAAGSAADTITDALIKSLPFVPASPETIEQAEARIINHMKFYYRVPLNPGGPPATPPSVGYATLENLVSWRCNPLRPQAPEIAIDRRSGFYQMAFDDWSSSVFGPMIIMGDPFTQDDGSYSSAKPDSGAAANGDVSWSPQFTYRSRFYAIYVLGRGLIADAASPTVTKDMGEKRLEAVYDALKDEILWQRAMLSDRRALGE